MLFEPASPRQIVPIARKFSKNQWTQKSISSNIRSFPSVFTSSIHACLHNGGKYLIFRWTLQPTKIDGLQKNQKNVQLCTDYLLTAAKKATSMGNSIDPVINIYVSDNEMFLNVISWSMIFAFAVLKVSSLVSMARKTAYELTKYARLVFIHQRHTFFFVRHCLFLCSTYYRVTGVLCAMCNAITLSTVVVREIEREVEKK